ncbi:glycosyltransferase family 4 protein [Neomoorella thermoacetica]|uniref:glycosyltransferase family 4 protein n=1 Tax=Neomoorella thermoacetica TaxID=1525 RepID=UPI0008FAE2A3|nr:glycosyltransferase family 4 protein [Moorella thermoacetica]OIQ59656.1 N,N'-diacetylbacillosaminyl-diphospho-undecaprenol alpha-1,3-N-acetylgalactosaminyltransferase [Moorella thermoacetica]
MEREIAIFTPNLLDWEGKKPVIGGLERYIRALAELLTDMGYAVSFHQNAHRDFQTTYLGWPVYGYQADPQHLNITIERIEKSVPGRVLYSSILQQVYYRPGSICISHGVWWELPGSSPVLARAAYENHVAAALFQASLIISCDYNFLNVARAIYPDLAGRKIQVIPNFVDLERFYPREGSSRKGIRVLYPRRLSRERGFTLLQAVIPSLLAAYPELEFQFAIDTNTPRYLEAFHAWRQGEAHNERLLYCHPDFDAMPGVYADADIVVIPTIYSEGTSFSCLEAMAMGKAIIATNVGGLTNLIIDNYNGLLIHPTAEYLAQALRFLIEHPRERARLGKNAAATARVFDRKLWEARWRQFINKVYPLG